MMTEAAALVSRYPLTPMQHGMLFDYLASGDPGIDVEQIVLRLAEPIDSGMLRAAWQAVVQRHANLRTSFEWDRSEGPLQIVHGDLPVPWAELDWQDLDAEACEASLDAWLNEDRARGFELDRPPLMRLALIRLGAEDYRCIWTFHHLLLDGRSFADVLTEVMAAYEELAGGGTLRAPGESLQFADYVSWTNALDHSASEGFWRGLLQGFRAPTPLLPSPPEHSEAPPGQRLGHVERTLDAAQRTALEALAQAGGFTLNTVVQGAWAILLARYSGETDVLFGATRAARNTALPGASSIVGLLINTLPVRAHLDWSEPLVPWLQALRAQQQAIRQHEHTPLVQVQRWSEVPAGTSLFDSVLIFDRELLGPQLRRLGGPWSQRDAYLVEQTGYPLTWYVYAEDEPVVRLAYDTRRFSQRTAERIVSQLLTLLGDIAADPHRTLGELSYLGHDEAAQLSKAGRGPDVDLLAETTLNRVFEAQVVSTPGAAALVSRDVSLSYAELNARANQLARQLRALGVGPDSLVGIFTERTPEMVVAVLAVHKAGGAYVPLDPEYPSERIDLMLADSRLSLVLTQEALRDRLPATTAATICLDTAPMGHHDAANLEGGAEGHNLAYVIYTSGSTGRPKGVMIEHRQVLSFFAGMDERIQSSGVGDTWLAVTSLSFDISVLELLWTLARGFRVVLHGETEPAARAGAGRTSADRAALAPPRELDFSLFYFAARTDSGLDAEPYRLLQEGARWADDHGFTAVWTPERHFHAFGGLYPNPAVIGAALAAQTSRIEIRAGSVVLPLHHPARVAEDWAVVDQLSGGRVGVSFASGWQPRDFVLAPENYGQDRERMFDAIDQVRRLWRGEGVSFPGHDGAAVEVQTLPRPVQPELPVWVTAAGNPDTFRRAGEIGANLLTHLLGQSLDELRDKIAVYRRAWIEAGHPGRGKVSLMLHTFVGESDDAVRETVRQPMKDYLGSAFNLVRDVAWSFPTLKSKTSAPTAEDIAALTPEETDALLDFAFERYFETSGLFGSPATCAAQLERIRAVEVDEVACLVDFGVDADITLQHLEGLGSLAASQQRADEEPDDIHYSLGALIERHAVTHFQCTPSQAQLLLADEAVRPALQLLRTWLIGGEAFPPALAPAIAAASAASIVNMYGPTETTIWSATEPVSGAPEVVPIGRPIANTALYVLDERGRPVPHGVSGELFIGGDAVVRGYLGQEELTAARFVPDPFSSKPDARMYRTGDRARFLEDGRVEFLGRLDFQVKIRGHRIELGEIEAALAAHPSVREAIVVARDDVPGEPRLAAYVVAAGTQRTDTAELREYLRRRLPAFMVPTHIVPLAEMPHTPNMKVDRKALPAPSEVSTEASTPAEAPTDDVAQLVAGIWSEALGVPRINLGDNFFDLGGDSLMVIRVHSRLKSMVSCNLALMDFFSFPTVRDLSDELSRRLAVDANATPVAVATAPGVGQRNAEARRSALARRSGRD